MTNNTTTPLPTNWTELQAAIEQWGTDRNFYGEGGATYEGQWMKLVEEFGELVLGLNKNKPELIKDALGDMVVVLVHMNRFYEDAPDCLLDEPARVLSKICTPTNTKLILDLVAKSYYQEMFAFVYAELLKRLQITSLQRLRVPLFDCVLASYLEIKDRKGQMLEGKFVKEADLNG